MTGTPLDNPGDAILAQSEAEQIAADATWRQQARNLGRYAKMLAEELRGQGLDESEVHALLIGYGTSRWVPVPPAGMMEVLERLAKTQEAAFDPMADESAFESEEPEEGEEPG